MKFKRGLTYRKQQIDDNLILLGFYASGERTPYYKDIENNIYVFSKQNEGYYLVEINTADFKRIGDFDKYKKSLGLEAIVRGDWAEQPNGIFVKPFITEEESERLDLTYIGLIFPNATNGHRYLTQTDTIHFITDGFIEFSKDEYSERRLVPFQACETIQIPPPIIRRLIPHAEESSKLEIELIVQPKFNPKDEIHIYD